MSNIAKKYRLIFCQGYVIDTTFYLAINAITILIPWELFF